MESTRDSSIWRSLAVAFGDGLAFGVGMKLTQQTARQTGVPAPADKSVAERLGEMERRLARMERAPALPAAPSAHALPQPQFDQKVLEAVVNALEARLKEQAGHMERRLAELEAKIAIELKALDRQDHAVEDRLLALNRDTLGALPKAIDAVEAKLDERTTLLHQVERRVDDLEDRASALRGELTAALPKAIDAVEAKLDERTTLLHQVERRVNDLEDRASAFRGELLETVPKVIDDRAQAVAAQVVAQADARINAVEDRMAALHHELAAGVEARSAELSARLSDMATFAADSAVDRKLTALRDTLQDKNREIADLRRQLVESEERSLELLLAIGQTCRDAADRMSRQAPPPPSVPAPVQEQPTPEPTAESASETTLPGFAQSKPPGRVLKLPLVSSMVVTVGSLVLLRFL